MKADQLKKMIKEEIQNIIGGYKLAPGRKRILINWYADRLESNHGIDDKHYAKEYATNQVNQLIDESNEEGIEWLNTVSKDEFIDDLSI